METHKAKRVEITIEALAQKRLTQGLLDAGISGFTIVPVVGGSGRSGFWSQDGQISRASGMIQLICIVRSEILDDLLESVIAVVERHIGVVCVTECEVLRAERF